MTQAYRRPSFLWLIRLFIGTPPASAVFTYGSTVYVPSGHALSPDLIEHERTHRVQQGRTPWFWWARYLIDRRFRYRQELAAYQAQLRYLRAVRQPHVLAVHHMARWLSDEMYGRICTFDEALDAIWGTIHVKA